MGRDSRADRHRSMGQGPVVVALGAAAHGDGGPSPAMRRRVAAAVQMVRQTPGAVLLLSGGTGKRHPPGAPTEARLMAELAAEAGLDRTDLLLEDRSRDTLGNARHALAVVAPLAVDRVIVVTDRPHLRRALWCFRAVARARRLRLHVDGVGVPIPDPRLARRAAVREALALLVYAPRLVRRGALAAPVAGGHDDGSVTAP